MKITHKKGSDVFDKILNQWGLGAMHWAKPLAELNDINASTKGGDK